jgi:dihydroneopterin triphosphate diphosphatase
MARAPFQVLVLPYRFVESGDVQYAILARVDYSCWQGIAGGGEDDETPLEAAKRESWEEAGIPTDCPYLQLETVNSIPVIHFRESYLWGEDRFVIPEYTFGVEVGGREIRLSPGHRHFQWLNFAEATALLTYEGIRIALWELNQRVQGKGPRD